MAWPENINPQRLRRPTNPLGIGVSLDFWGISIRYFPLEPASYNLAKTWQSGIYFQ
jgi:hypothetical protein